MQPSAGRPPTLSPYQIAFGGLPDGLHPRLRAYFAGIPEGSHGYGEGVFAVAGVRRRWLRPLLAAVVPTDVMFPVWERDVPFTVVNHPVVDAEGRVAVTATRRFRFRSGERVMTDVITATSGGLVDHLGADRRFAAALTASVVDGALHLESTGVTVLLGKGRAGPPRLRWPRLVLPRFIAPRVHLTERFDDATGRQHLTLVIDAPVIGKVYEYAGSFSYEIRPGEGPS